MSQWKKNLSEGQIKVVEEILEQIPTTMGFRDVFVGILDSMVDGKGAAKPDVFRFIIANDGDVQGTNDPEKARHHAGNDEAYVIDVQNMSWLVSGDEDDDSGISELK